MRRYQRRTAEIVGRLIELAVRGDQWESIETELGMPVGKSAAAWVFGQRASEEQKAARAEALRERKRRYDARAALIIAELRAGCVHDEVARKFNLAKSSVSSVWGRCATEADKKAREAALASRGKRVVKQYERVATVPTKSAPDAIFDGPVFADDPRAVVADCHRDSRFKAYAPPRAHSETGCSAAWAAMP